MKIINWAPRTLDFLVQLRRDERRRVQDIFFFFLLIFDPRDTLGGNDAVDAVLVVLFILIYEAPQPSAMRGLLCIGNES